MHIRETETVHGVGRMSRHFLLIKDKCVFINRLQ